MLALAKPSIMGLAVETDCTVGGANRMRVFNMVVERDPDTGLYVGHVPGWPGAHSQGTTIEELQTNLQEVVLMLLEDGEPKLESEFIGVQTLRVS
jgi:predicted RNase H-like HicB family nuclease